MSAKYSYPRTLRPGDIVILNNLPAHRMPAARRAVEQAGPSMSIMSLLPYSPDFNPIEMAFSKLKSLMRSREERTVAAL